MRKHEEVVELTKWRLQQVSKEIDANFRMTNAGPWVTVQFFRKEDNTLFFQVKERGWLAAVKAAELRAEELTSHRF